MQRRAFLAALAGLGLIGCDKADAPRLVPLPKNPNGPLRVWHAVNPALPRLSEVEFSRVLRSAEHTVKNHLQLDIQLQPVGDIDIGQLFARLPEISRNRRQGNIIQHDEPEAFRRLYLTYQDGLQRKPKEFAAMVDYVLPLLPVQPAGRSLEQIADAVARTHLQRLNQALASLPDSQRHGSALQYTQFEWWDALGEGELDAEVIITNQLIASAETTAPSVHTALRGGITNGNTAYSKASRNQTFVVWSTYNYLSDAPDIVALRGGETYSREEIADLAGIGLSHELGHMLLHLGHPWDNPACVMHPIPLLRYRAAAQALDPPRCRVGSHPQMRPGVVDFPY